MSTAALFDVMSVRKDFPCLNQTVHSLPLVYFDSAASAQKPQCVMDAQNDYYNRFTSNIHRGAHHLSETATAHYHNARKTVANFMGARAEEIVFTRSATESINLVASSLGKTYFESGDEIILSEMEHHANIVPWFLLAKEKSLTLKIIPVLNDGTLDLVAYKNLFSKKTKLVAFGHASNALGTINPVYDMVALAKAHGVLTLIDGAQAAPHLALDMVKLETDFYCFSGHKTYGPTGIGVLYAKNPWLDNLPPYQSGGDMIASVSFDGISFAKGPQKFEAGTPHIAGALGLAKALEYLSEHDLSKIHAYEQSLHDYALEQISAHKKVHVLGPKDNKVSLISFVVDGVHPHDLSSIFDRQGIAIRAGHLCAQPLLRRFGVSALARASFAFYNTREEIDHFINAFVRVFEVFRL